VEVVLLSRKGENIYKRKDGRWEGRYIKSRINLKVRYGYVYGKTYKETRQKLTELRSNVMESQKETVTPNGTFKTCAVAWLSEKECVIKHSTCIKYSNMLDKYVIPDIGKLDIGLIGYDCISELCNNLLRNGGKLNNGLSTKTVSDILSVVKSVLKYASRSNYKIDTSAFDVSVKTKYKPIRVLSVQEQTKLMDYLTSNISDINIGIMFSLFTGIRIGELCALTWGDISMEAHTIYISKTLQRVQTPQGIKKTAVTITEPKSENSNRHIPIPQILYDMLNPSNNKSFYILTNSEKYIEPRLMEYHFSKVISKCGISNANFHALRHTFATRCIEVGFDVKSLSEILGHANVNITLNRYVHPSEDSKRENMDRLSQLFAVK
jgi:integrase